MAAEALQRQAVDRGLAVDRQPAAKGYRRRPACRKFRKTAPGPGPRTLYKMPSSPPEGSKVRKPRALGKLQGPGLAGGHGRTADKLKNSLNYVEFCIDVVQPLGFRTGACW